MSQTLSHLIITFIRGTVFFTVLSILVHSWHFVPFTVGAYFISLLASIFIITVVTLHHKLVQ